MANKVTIDVGTGVVTSEDVQVTRTDPSLEDIQNNKSLDLKMSIASLLEKSDYIILKIQEAEMLGQETATMLSNYSAELSYRQNVRAWNATQESAIAAATTIEELNAIDVTSGPQA